MKRNIFSPAALITGFVILAALGCKSDAPNSFNPATLTVARGTTITWRNDDSSVHTATSDITGWDTGDMPRGATKTTLFSTAGAFKYHCTYHRAMGMVGTIIVQ